MKKSRQQGKEGEISCEKYLIRHNYRIIQKQPVFEGRLLIDNKSYFYSIRPDFLVRKRGKRYLVEVKKGKTVSSPLVKEVRRQLLEYRTLFNTAGILFFDGRNRTLHKVRFPALQKRNKVILYFSCGMAAGIILTILVFYYPGILSLFN